MATLTNTGVGSGAGDRSPSPGRKSGGGRGASSAPARSGAVSGGLDDLAAQFNQRRYRPLGVSDLFDEAFDLYRSNFVLFLGAAALILVPLNIAIYEFVLPHLNVAARSLMQGTTDPSLIWNFLGDAGSATLTTMIVYALFYVLLSGASIGIASNRYLGRPAELWSTYKSAARRALPLLLCVIAAFLAVALGTALCILPGIWMFCRLALLPQVAVLEPSRNPFAALGRAWRMTAAHTGRIFSILLLLALVSFVIQVSLQGPIQLALSVLPLDSLPFLSEIARHRDLSLDVANVTSGLLTTPFTFIALTALYYDLRIRDEGYDMAVLADQLGFGDPKAWAKSALPHAGAPLRASVGVGIGVKQPSVRTRRARKPGTPQ